VKGGGHTGATTGAMVATSIIFFPAAPLFLFMKGKDITIPKGTEVTAFVSGDMPLDMAKFQGPAGVAPTSVASGATELHMSSTPAEAEISIDGNFVGLRPASLSQFGLNLRARQMCQLTRLSRPLQPSAA
jgi:hypothetical protein